MNDQPTNTQPDNDESPRDWKAELIAPIGYALGLSYPVLALSTGVRSLYQLFFKAGVTYYLPPALSGIAALCYLTATIGFFSRKQWAWKLSVGVLGLETFLTLLVGTLSFIIPDVIGSTVWRAFGQDYGYFPLVQPLFGLFWLFWPGTRVLYGMIATPTAGAQTET